ncbi:MAG TPA: peptidase M22, partial [Clostridiales bacterium]|nr:peptidase M22 [Clostridiales bacterium]
MIKIHCGIDTSLYTTSAAAVTEEGTMFSVSRLLAVKEGERGVRQSDALFQH